MKHEVKVDDRFKLGKWEWQVARVRPGAFTAVAIHINPMTIDMDARDADQLDWIEPEATFTQAQADVLKGQISHAMCNANKSRDAEDLLVEWLDEHTEK